ncbi:hypothetical protein DFH09DRAFT_1494842 [Mycena vulgaris]|nr:hypothetical protein DFH09DRAFT_1494842 [Mycena vulgaris]
MAFHSDESRRARPRAIDIHAALQSVLCFRTDSQGTLSQTIVFQAKIDRSPHARKRFRCHSDFIQTPAFRASSSGCDEITAQTLQMPNKHHSTSECAGPGRIQTAPDSDIPATRGSFSPALHSTPPFTSGITPPSTPSTTALQLDTLRRTYYDGCPQPLPPCAEGTKHECKEHLSMWGSIPLCRIPRWILTRYYPDSNQKAGAGHNLGFKLIPEPRPSEFGPALRTASE